MDALLILLIQGFGVVLVDVDDTMYTTERISGLATRRRLALVLSLSLEFVGRVGLLYLPQVHRCEKTAVRAVRPSVYRGNDLSVCGRSLPARQQRAGSNGSSAESDCKESSPPAATTSFPRLMIEMTIVLTIMSVGIALVVVSATTVLGVNIPGPVYILTFSPSFGIVEA